MAVFLQFLNVVLSWYAAESLLLLLLLLLLVVVVVFSKICLANLSEMLVQSSLKQNMHLLVVFILFRTSNFRVLTAFLCFSLSQFTFMTVKCYSRRQEAAVVV
jgi:hypothetical protein